MLVMNTTFHRILLVLANPQLRTAVGEAPRQRVPAGQDLPLQTVDAPALNGFLETVIQEHPRVAGTDLTRSRREGQWEALDYNPFWTLVSGEWLYDPNGYLARVLSPGRAQARPRWRPLLSTYICHRFILLWPSEENAGIFIEGTHRSDGTMMLETVSKRPFGELNWR